MILQLIAYATMPQLNAHADVFSIARGLIFSLDLHLDPYFVYAQARQSPSCDKYRGAFNDKINFIGQDKQK